MLEVRKTDAFVAWFDDLRDRAARLRIQVRIDRLAFGNPGEHRNLPGGVSELKIDVGPGYRVYYTQRSGTLVVLLCGGDKRSQQRDIAAARALARQLEE
jgi:putative addiction module killer protein